MKACSSLLILALSLLTHFHPSPIFCISCEALALRRPSSSAPPRSASRRLQSNESSPPSTPSACCSGSTSCPSAADAACIATRTAPNILPHSRTLTIIVVVIFVACILMGFFSVYARRFCIPEGVLSYQSMERAEYRGNEALVGSLPIVQYRAAAAAAGDLQDLQGKAISMQKKECAVCLSEFEEGETIRVLPACCHLFHKDCIDMWLFSHSTCPLCRLSLFSSNRLPPRPPAVDLQPMLSSHQPHDQPPPLPPATLSA